jgi:geranylgeranyl pyrophosphate synthase
MKEKGQKMGISEVYEYLKEDLERVEDELREQLRTDNKSLLPINEHILSMPGKRLRPILVLLTSKAYNYRGG